LYHRERAASDQHSEELHRNGRKARKGEQEGKFPFFASFATFAVKQVWLMADC
jgi:hypothetical protein